MRRLASSMDSVQIGLLESVLEAAGVPYEVRNVAMSQLAGPCLINPLELWVLRDEDYEEAQRLMANSEQNTPDPQIRLRDVQAVYSGPERKLWELLMGEQIHIGGFQSSMDLAERAGIRGGGHGVDLCCATGGGMRFLVRFRSVTRMTGVDATPAMLELGRQRCLDEGLTDRINFIEADVTDSHLTSGQFDFVWGEDAWCYVEDKLRLIAEAARLVKAGGTIAFTDWLEGPKPLTRADAQRFKRFMKFPTVFRLVDYRSALEANGCTVRTALDTARFPSHTQLYIDMIERQLTYDALKIINFDSDFAAILLEEMRFMHALAKSGKICQGLIVATRSA